MYILQWLQGDRQQYVGVFDKIENGREFMKKIPGYRHEVVVEEDGFAYENEHISYAALPEIEMIAYNGFRVPVSKFSFEEDILVIWIELDHLDQCHEDRDTDAGRIATGATRVDAYSINNEDVEAYVRSRESKYKQCLEVLEKLGYEAERAFYGSEDGEAILYRKKTANASSESGEWHFLTHMDPSFVEMDVEEELPRLLNES